MAGYTYTWDCWVCGKHCDTIDNPKVKVCHACIQPLAGVLCKRAMGVPLDSEGVDRSHWERKAWEYAEILFRRRPSNIRRAA